MDHVVYLDSRAKKFENIKNGSKTMIIRGAMGRKMPHGRVQSGDVLYFIENDGSGIIKGKAVAGSIFNSDKLSKEESARVVEENQDRLLLNGGLKKRFAGKRYLVLISLKDFQETEPFQIDRSGYKNMDDWLPVEAIESVMIK